MTAVQAEQIPLVEDSAVPMIFYDGLAKAEVSAGVLRMVAFVFRENPVTRLRERIPVAVFVRPVNTSMEIFQEISRAMRRDLAALAMVH